MANLQSNLEGEILKAELEDPERPWRGICSPGCWMAKGDKCRCRCGGAHHGKGRKKEVDPEK